MKNINLSAEVTSFDEISSIGNIQLLDFHLLTGVDIVFRVRLLLQLVQELFGLFRNMYFPGFASLLKFIGHDHVRPVDIVAHDLRPHDAADNRARMYPDPHVQTVKGRLLLLHLVDLLQHVKRKTQHVFGLFHGISVVTVGKPEHDVTVANRIHLVHVLLCAENVELLEKTPQHSHHVLRLFTILRSVRKLSKALNIRKENGALLEKVRQL